MEELHLFLSNIMDERQEWKVLHKLPDIVFIVLMATLANADDWHEIEIFARANEIFARANEAVLKKYAELKNGIPSHDTLGTRKSLLYQEQKSVA